MNKIIVFSHESDIDGIGCIILAKLAFNDLDYVLLPNVEKLELTFREYLENGKLDNYNKIFVTDLALFDPALTMVANSSLKDKVLVFDHHKMSIDKGKDRYSFTKIIEEDENGLRCGTDLFFEYLVSSNLIKTTRSIEEFVELTRLEDTWEWKEKEELGKIAHGLSYLFNSIGIDEYISRMIKTIKNNFDSFVLSDDDKQIIENKRKEYETTLKEILSKAEYFSDEDNNKYGIVYSNYEYRNDLPEYIIGLDNPNSIKYLIIVAMDKGENGQKSYRSIDKSFDVNKVAMKHGGGGHPASACVAITKEQKEQALNMNNKDGLYYLANSNYSQ